MAVLPHGLLHGLAVSVLLVGHLLAGLLHDDQLVAVAAALRDGVAQAGPFLDVRQFVQHEPCGRFDLAARTGRLVEREILTRLLERVEQQAHENARVAGHAAVTARLGQHVHGVASQHHAFRVDQSRIGRTQIHAGAHVRVGEDAERVLHAEPLAAFLTGIDVRQRVQRRGPTVHLAFVRVLADQVCGLLRVLRRQAPLVAVVDGAVRDRGRVQHGLHVHGRAHAPLLVVRTGPHAADRDHGLRAAHRHRRIVATLQRRPVHVVPRIRIVLRDAFRVEDVRGARATATIRRAGHPILHAAFTQVTRRFDDVPSRGGREHEARRLDHGGDDDADGLAGTGRTQYVDVPFGTQPHLHVPRIAHIPCGMPGSGADGARLPVAEIRQHARQYGRDHVTVDGPRPIVRGELTPRGHAGTRGQPVRRAFLGITVRVPEDPQGHDNHERDREHGQRQQRPGEHVALDGEEQDHREDQREHAHHRADTRHEMAFLVRETFQQVRVPAQPYARLR